MVNDSLERNYAVARAAALRPLLGAYTAKAFSHRPTLLSLADDCAQVKHDGKVPGYLYAIDEAIAPGDVSYLRDTGQTHWQTQRNLPVRLLAELPTDDPPRLTNQEVAALRQGISEGSTGFVGEPDRG